MEEKASQFNKVNLLIPSHKKLKDLMQFLSIQTSNPFCNFFLTNKLKEKPQFTLEKDLKEIKDECKKDKDGNFVLLCYQEKKNTAEEALTLKSLPSTHTLPSEAEKEKEKEDNGCDMM
jgi:hypothetical protein